MNLSVIRTSLLQVEHRRGTRLPQVEHRRETRLPQVDIAAGY